MPELKILFLQMLVILLAAKALGLLFRLIHQPEVLGEMLAGILLGPSLLGRVAPQVMEQLFAPASLGPLYALSQVGLVLFMFLVGLEVHPGLLRQSAKSAILRSQASLAAPLVCGAIWPARSISGWAQARPGYRLCFFSAPPWVLPRFRCWRAF
jgi:Kef-type K+ transport system membrane component KefB